MNTYGAGLAMLAFVVVLSVVAAARGRAKYLSGPYVCGAVGSWSIMFSEALPPLAIAAGVVVYLGGFVYLIALCTGKDMTS